MAWSPFAEELIRSPFFAFLMNLLHGIAQLRTPFGNVLMQGLTFLGEETVFIVVGMLLVWCLDKKWGYRFLSMFMVGNLFNQVFKALFLIPRPWIIDPDFEIVESAREAASGFSFPSGHTQSAVLTIGGLSLWIKKRWAYIAAVVLSLLVGFSRMYLGVHTLFDVGVSWITGLLILLVMNRVLSRIADRPKPFAVLLGIGFGLCVAFLVFLYVSPDRIYYTYAEHKNAYILLGTTVGFILGWVVDTLWVKFDHRAVWWVQLIKIVLGAALVVGIRSALKALFGGSTAAPWLHGLRYGIMTFVAIGIYPLLFKPLVRLSERKQRKA